MKAIPEPRPLFKTDQYLDAVWSLAFEAYHMKKFADLWKESDVERRKLKTPKERTYFNQLFESACFIHLRNVLYFFYFPPKQPLADDVLLSDFKPVLTNFKLPPNFKAPQAKKNLDKRVAHLTLGRRSGQPGVNLYFMCSEGLHDAVEAFVAALRDDLKKAFNVRMAAFIDRDRNVAPIEF
jgi:hypothetical protein